MQNHQKNSNDKMEANKQKFELFGNEIKERKFELLLLNFLGW